MPHPPLTVHEYGDPVAPPLVLLHGLTDSGPSWAAAIRHWSPDYRVLAPDQLGHGTSPRFTAQQLADEDPVEHLYTALEQSIEEACGGARPVVVGHSMGGGMAAALGARRPDLVRGLVLEDPAWLDRAPWGSPEELTRARVQECVTAAADLDREVARGRAEHPEWPAEELRPWAEASAAMDLDFVATGHAVLRTPWREIARAIAVPTLVVTGTEAVILDESALAAVAGLGNPHLEVVVVPGAGHCVRRDRTREFHRVVDPWLEALSRPRPPG